VLNGRPTHAIANGCHPNRPDEAVIGGGLHVVLCGRNQVEARTEPVDMAGSFEPTHPERSKQL
jgi:hypothetical protein